MPTKKKPTPIAKKVAPLEYRPILSSARRVGNAGATFALDISIPPPYSHLRGLFIHSSSSTSFDRIMVDLRQLGPLAQLEGSKPGWIGQTPEVPDWQKFTAESVPSGVETKAKSLLDAIVEAVLERENHSGLLASFVPNQLGSLTFSPKSQSHVAESLRVALQDIGFAGSAPTIQWTPLDQQDKATATGIADRLYFGGGEGSYIARRPILEELDAVPELEAKIKEHLVDVPGLSVSMVRRVYLVHYPGSAAVRYHNGKDLYNSPSFQAPIVSGNRVVFTLPGPVPVAWVGRCWGLEAKIATRSSYSCWLGPIYFATKEDIIESLKEFKPNMLEGFEFWDEYTFLASHLCEQMSGGFAAYNPATWLRRQLSLRQWILSYGAIKARDRLGATVLGGDQVLAISNPGGNSPPDNPAKLRFQTAGLL